MPYMVRRRGDECVDWSGENYSVTAGVQPDAGQPGFFWKRPKTRRTRGRHVAEGIMLVMAGVQRIPDNGAGTYEGSSLAGEIIEVLCR